MKQSVLEAITCIQLETAVAMDEEVSKNKPEISAVIQEHDTGTKSPVQKQQTIILQQQVSSLSPE
ncbi:hypothetical protein FRB96_009538 [Tulasnella sp. 330]|nr:hypothetical protein FRB96_009538 [Tulasnella sp. 330]